MEGLRGRSASEIGPLYFGDPEPVNEDGTFRIEAVLPGDYQVFIANEDRSIYKVHSIHVPTEDATRPAGPLRELGRIAVVAGGAGEDEPREELDAPGSL